MSGADTTAKAAATQLRPYQWRPGQSGNPRGGKKGARRKLADAFCRDMLEAWEDGGPAIIRAAAIKNPVAFIQVIAHIMPKDFQLELEAGPNFKALWAALAEGKLPDYDTAAAETDD